MEHAMDNSNNADATTHDQIVYWHRDLPPLDAELVADHTVEATSGRVAGTLSHRDELWDRCYHELMSNVQARLAQEITRLGGDYAHIHDESIADPPRRCGRRGLVARLLRTCCTRRPSPSS